MRILYETKRKMSSSPTEGCFCFQASSQELASLQVPALVRDRDDMVQASTMQEMSYVASVTAVLLLCLVSPM